MISDLLGLSSKKPPSFVKPFANLYNEIEETLKNLKNLLKIGHIIIKAGVNICVNVIRDPQVMHEWAKN